MHNRAAICTALLIGAALTGCGQGAEPVASTEVVAKVNSREITVHQINGVLARTRNLPPETAGKAKEHAVERLINQELARQEALGKKLDRTPEVVQAIEAARTEILARAYLRQVAAAQAQPTPEEVRRYYAEHPELFSQRHVYVLEEIGFARDPELADALRGALPKLRSMSQAAEWLRKREVQFSMTRATRAAEQIPLDLLRNVSVLNDGEMRVLDATERHVVVRVVARKPAPVDEESALPAIRRYLANRNSAELVAEELKRLRDKAQIEYVGKFAPDAVAAPAQPARTAALEDIVEKGLRGLR